jgi:hypothetical protein
MTKKNISEEDYQKYVKDHISNKFATRWDYLEYYNKRDVEIMIKSISYFINFWAEHHINMLDFMILASCSQAAKYAFLYKDMTIFEDYNTEDNEVRFVLKTNWIKRKYWRYDQQDTAKKRVPANITN